MLAPGFWEEQEGAHQVTRQVSLLRGRTEAFFELTGAYDNLEVLAELGKDGEEPEIIKELRDELAVLQRKVSEMELAVLLNGPYDQGNAIISLHAGAGGTEAQDWVDMLLRMYLKWAENHGFRTDILDFLPGEEAGTKSITVEVVGINAYGYLSPEKGVHRLVRISPFDAAGRRHTSFASLDVLPEVDEDVEVQINPEEIRIDTFRSSGAGGQHINKTDSAVRITHLPTNIVVTCQNQRSQIANRQKAMKMLQARLIDLELQKKEAELAALRGQQQDIAWGSQIRSYVFHPYSLVKDHRTGVENGNVNAVMDGEIDPFITAYLQEKARNQGGARRT